MTEFVGGGSLAQFLRAAGGPLPLRLRCELALQAANGLAYLHELRIVHFDLKPDNLLLDGPPALILAAARSGAPPGTAGDGGAAAGEGAEAPALAAAAAVAAAAAAAAWFPTVKVADFGLSKHKLNSYVSSCRDLRGTLPYMAPELVADPERVSEKADVWSLGVVMWEMAAREVPYQDLTPQQILKGLMCGGLHLDAPPWCEPEWAGLLEACLEPNPDNRPAMRDLCRHLEAILRDQAATAAAAAAVEAAAAAEAEADAAAVPACVGDGSTVPS
ncbi:MAG: kinase-like protein [Monoraphidium minutum]|nr:MAG: kinase-like protein [Monoraphidium minutum]